jgi:hypothetical protein
MVMKVLFELIWWSTKSGRQPDAASPPNVVLMRCWKWRLDLYAKRNAIAGGRSVTPDDSGKYLSD